jgi:hypothetical protein
LLSPNGARAFGASPRIWQTFEAALALAERLEVGASAGGLCYVMAPQEDGIFYGGVFFLLPRPDRPGRPLMVFGEPGADS